MSSPARLAALAGRAGRLGLALPEARAALSAALALESAERRFFLWLPMAAIGGVALNLAADREPALSPPLALTGLALALALASRRRPVARGFWLAVAALAAGFLSMGLRTGRVATPMLDHIRIVDLKGFVEEVDYREIGARFVLHVADPGDMPASLSPRRVRLTMRKTSDLAAGDFVAVKARLIPPSPAVIPGGYSFARDAYFSGVGAVGSTLGAVKPLAAPADLSRIQRFYAALDQGRNQLARRVDTLIGGDEGAIAAAMVTGKRDFLSSSAKDLIREAGIFHIITISGIQVTLVSGIFFVVARRGLALSPWLAMHAPLKKIAAVVAMAGSLFYDMATGSRVGTERALAMTLIVLGAVVLDRRALTMRNLAFAIFAVVALEPEAVMGVSFQLSFAAVAALVAVSEQRLARLDATTDPFAPVRPVSSNPLARAARWARDLLFATACATGATVSFMAYHFHDHQPLRADRQSADADRHRGLRRALARCLGAALYPLGTRRTGSGSMSGLWHPNSFCGIARFIAAGSRLHACILRAFAPFVAAVSGARGR